MYAIRSKKSVFELGICQTKKTFTKIRTPESLGLYFSGTIRWKYKQSFNLTIAYKRPFLNSQENSVNPPDLGHDQRSQRLEGWYCSTSCPAPVLACKEGAKHDLTFVEATKHMQYHAHTKTGDA